MNQPENLQENKSKIVISLFRPQTTTTVQSTFDPAPKSSRIVLNFEKSEIIESDPQPIHPAQSFISPEPFIFDNQIQPQIIEDCNMSEIQPFYEIPEQPFSIINNQEAILENSQPHENINISVPTFNSFPSFAPNTYDDQQNNISSVKLRIPPQNNIPKPATWKLHENNFHASSVIPMQLENFNNLQNSAQPAGLQQPLSPFPVHNYPQTPIGAFNYFAPQPEPIMRPKKMNVPLTELYIISKRQLSMMIDPLSLNFKAQLIVSFELQSSAEIWLQKQKEIEYPKLNLEMKLNAKNIQVTNIYELNNDQVRIKQYIFNEDAQQPSRQAQVHQQHFPNLLQLSDLNHDERQFQSQDKSDGTIKLKRKIIGLRPVKQSVPEMLSKLKPQIKILIEYQCDAITQGSALRYVSYLDDQNKKTRYIYTVDHNSECWMPQLIGAENKQSPWQLKFSVPQDYMVISSGVQTQRIQDNRNALHVYEVEQACQDRIGFICCKFPKITTIEKGNCVKGQYGCFLNSQKQSYFNESYLVEVMDYLQNLLGVTQYPCKQVHLVFVPNLMPKKFPKQSISFGEGLHIFDEQILVRPNQIDKRHHLYKHVASAITFDFFGGKVREAQPGDRWLITAIRERMGDRMKKKKCGMLLHKYQVMRSIEYLYKQMKHGAEKSPLMSNQSDKTRSGNYFTLEQPLNDIFYRKCSLIMHMIESTIDATKLNKIIKELYNDAIQTDGLVSHLHFRKKFKQLVGFKPTVYYQNWIWTTSCPELELSYEFNKRDNTLNLFLKQTSAVQYGQTENQNLSSKLDRIFTSQKVADELTQPLDSIYIECSSAARRWFVGEINIVIYQIEGNGGDIIQQQHKMLLKDFKSTSTSHIPLQGKVKKAMNNRKKEDQQYSKEQNMQRNFGQFTMNEFELEDYPLETKNIFNNLDSNPVLWIRVDPDMEFIRKVKIVQEKRNNWLFQLLREQDIIGQIEAVRRLHKYNEELVYGILKTVANSENFFYKVRKEVLQALNKMEIFTFQQHLSHEMYLIKMFNKPRMLPDLTFYRENNFSKILEYFMGRALLKAISKCKEESLLLTQEKAIYLNERKQQREKQVKQENGDQAQIEEQASEPTTNANAIQLFIDSKVIRQRRSKVRFDESQFKCTTENVARMLMKVLEQNDNSENHFDDSFYLKDVLISLGRLDKIELMPDIAKEIQRQFKLDQISNSSPQFAITIGAIKAYFNLRKSIFKFKSEKESNLDQNQEKVYLYNEYIDKTSQIMQEIKHDIDKLLLDQYSPLHIRLFIFKEEVKNLLKFRNQNFAQALVTILKIIDGVQAQGQLMFALYSLRDLVLYLEQKNFYNGKLSMIDVYLPQFQSEVKNCIWKLYSYPHAYLTCEYTFWTKRLIARLFSNQIPGCELKYQVEYDKNWSQTESELQQQQVNIQQQTDQLPTFIQQQISMANNSQTTDVQIQSSILQQQLQPHVKEKKNLSDWNEAQSYAAGAKTFKIQIGIKNTANDEDLEMVSDNSQNKDEPSIVEADVSYDFDPFRDIKFDDPIMQRCWDVLGKLYYHYEITDFLEPITPESFGQQLYDDYCSVVENPMDITTIMERMKAHEYMEECSGNSTLAKEMFRRDVNLIFSNCREFNEKGSDIVKTAGRIKKEFDKLWIENNLI